MRPPSSFPSRKEARDKEQDNTGEHDYQPYWSTPSDEGIVGLGERVSSPEAENDEHQP